MKVFQTVRYNFVSEIGGKTYRECTLGPNLDATADGAAQVVMWMLNNDGVMNIKRRVK